MTNNYECKIATFLVDNQYYGFNHNRFDFFYHIP